MPAPIVFGGNSARLPQAVENSGHSLSLFGEDGFNFRDLIDIVNPLHHIPLIGNAYRKLTGDVIAPAMRVAGGALFGGPLGAAFAAAGVLINQAGSTAVAAQAERQQGSKAAPGGWMVANSRNPPPTPSTRSSREVASIAPTTKPAADAPSRRGGWMVEAAYAMADSRAQSSERQRTIDALA